MFCIHCGKSNIESARFCAHCGEAIISSPNESSAKYARSKNTEWEYTFYNRNWKVKNGGRWNLVFGTTEYSVRLDNWGKDQDSIMPELQEYLDEGWQYVNPPGPNSYRFMEHKDYVSTGNGGVNITWLSVSSFVVDFRRPASPLDKQEKLLVGIWQETNDPNNGFWNKVGNILASQKLSVNRYKYEFRKDHTFSHTSRDGIELSEGVFYKNENDGIDLFYKYTPDEDRTILVSENKIIFPETKMLLRQEYERVINK